MGILSSILDVLFPPRCVFCRSFLRGEEKRVCHACSENLPCTTGGGKRTGDFFSVCVAPLYYEGHVRESILRFKFKDATAYAKVYGKYLASCITEQLSGSYDLISWVPLSSKRLKERGYDQSMLLAMAAALELNDVAVCTLEKIKDVEKQSLMGSPEKRKANISGAYHAADPELVYGKRVLLIDDIITTGSTLSECARTLLEAGAAEVLCATVACTRE